MDNDRHIWRTWADFLHRWGMKEWTASLLEAAGPLSLFGAQVFYMSQPFFSQTRWSAQLDALSRVFDDSETTQAFVDYLRGGPHESGS